MDGCLLILKSRRGWIEGDLQSQAFSGSLSLPPPLFAPSLCPLTTVLRSSSTSSDYFLGLRGSSRRLRRGDLSQRKRESRKGVGGTGSGRFGSQFGRQSRGSLVARLDLAGLEGSDLQFDGPGLGYLCRVFSCWVRVSLGKGGRGAMRREREYEANSGLLFFAASGFLSLSHFPFFFSFEGRRFARPAAALTGIEAKDNYCGYCEAKDRGA